MVGSCGGAWPWIRATQLPEAHQQTLRLLVRGLATRQSARYNKGWMAHADEQAAVGRVCAAPHRRASQHTRHCCLGLRGRHGLHAAAAWSKRCGSHSSRVPIAGSSWCCQSRDRCSARARSKCWRRRMRNQAICWAYGWAGCITATRPTTLRGKKLTGRGSRRVGSRAWALLQDGIRRWRWQLAMSQLIHAQHLGAGEREGKGREGSEMWW